MKNEKQRALIETIRAFLEHLNPYLSQKDRDALAMGYALVVRAILEAEIELNEGEDK